MENVVKTIYRTQVEARMELGLLDLNKNIQKLSKSKNNRVQRKCNKTIYRIWIASRTVLGLLDPNRNPTM